MTRLITSAPTTSTARALPDSSCAVARERAERKPVQAAPTSTAPAEGAPIRLAISGAACGSIWSGVEVATSTRSRSAGSRPASARALEPASAPRSTSVSPLTRRRRWMPVRDEIHSESTPSGAASSSFSTTRSGRAAAMAAMPGAALRFAPFVFTPVARATSPSGSTSEASTSHCCPGERSGKSRLPGGNGLGLGAIERPPDQSGEDLPRSDVEIPPHAELAEPAENRRPADRADERGGERVARVVVEEFRRGRANDGSTRGLEIDLVELGPESLHPRRHGLGVEGARDGQLLRAHARALRGGVGILDPRQRPGEDELLRRVLVGQG